jgi:hypothetical protein
MPSLINRKLAVSRSAAVSREHNPRNLELPWYAFWSIALSRLAEQLHIEHCYVSSQFPLWRLWIEDEDEPELRPADTEHEDDLSDEYMDVDSSFSSESVAATWRGQKYKNRVTDFALIFRVPSEDYTNHGSDSDLDNDEPMQIPDLPTLAGVKYWETVPVLVEIKRFVSRSQPADTLKEAVDDRIEIAKNDVLQQASEFLVSWTVWLSNGL